MVSIAEELQSEYWAKKILSFYWIMIIISILGAVLALFVTLYYYPEWLVDYMLFKMFLPTFLQLTVILACEYMVKVKKNYNSYMLIFTGTMIALIIIVINPGINGIQLTLFIPMAISLVFLQMRKLVFSFLLNIVCYILIYFMLPLIRTHSNLYDFSAHLLILVAGFVIFNAVLQRGEEVIITLQKATKKEQELMIRTAIMEKLSKTDALTGLYNHKNFYGYLSDLVNQSKQYDMPLQLAIIDIDNFKKVNDQFGHDVGDLIIKRMTKLLSSHATSDDIVARYGGEEFAIIFTEKTLDQSYQIVEEIRKSIMNMKHRELDGKSITVSIGLKQFDPSLNKSTFFKEADRLLYEAKMSGKNKVVY